MVAHVIVCWQRGIPFYPGVICKWYADKDHDDDNS